MNRLELDATERVEIARLLENLGTQYGDLESEDFLEQVPVLAHDLPGRVRDTINAFRLERLGGTLAISGYEVDQEGLGNTPTHWRERPPESPAWREEALLLMYASLLGDPFGWVTQQDGHLIHDVLPIAGHEYEQIGSSSRSLLTWHTEDAFHPLRSDYLLFACLRNPYAAATTVGSVDDLELPENIRDVLFEKRFYIQPDESHLPKNNSDQAAADFTGIEERWNRPDLMAVLFGDPAKPYIRVDPYFMSVDDDDEQADEALAYLVKVLDDEMHDVHLDTGDFFFIDNYRVVHGRKPFEPRHDGTDRWLKRVNVTKDLRKSRQARQSLTARAVQ